MLPYSSAVRPRGEASHLPIAAPAASTKAKPAGSHVPLALRVGILGALTFQTTTYTLLRRYSQAVRGESYSSGSVLCVSEVLKCVVSLVGVWSTLDERKRAESGGGLVAWLAHLVATAAPMAVPSLLYLVMNMLSFFALRNVDAATFSLLFQLKLVTTAVFSFVLLGKRFSPAQCRALLLIVIGVMQITLNTMPHSDPGPCPTATATATATTASTNASDHNNGGEGGGEKGGEKGEGGDQLGAFVLGVLAALVEVTLSGLCTVYIERVLKDTAGHRALSVWDRNFQLAVCSVPSYVAVVWVGQGGLGGFFSGWSVLAVLLSAIGAWGGIMVALCLKFTDAILKNFASTGSIVLTTGLSWVWMGGVMNFHIAAASVVVVVAVFNYTGAAPPPAKS